MGVAWGQIEKFRESKGVLRDHNSKDREYNDQKDKSRVQIISILSSITDKAFTRLDHVNTL
jgi:uncharacterized membrane protein YfhO